MLRKIYYSLFLFLVSGMAVAQSGSIKGKVVDQSNGEELAFVNVIAYRSGNQVSGVNTDFEGEFVVKPLEAGTYDLLFSYVGYGDKRINGVLVQNGKITFLDVKLNAGIQLEAAEVVVYKKPLIDKDGGASGGAVSREDISKMPGRSATSIATTVAGASDAGTGGGISIRGARSSSTFVYIDGIKVRGSSALPKSAVQEISVMTGGIPANFGDATGGVINISLRGAAAQYGGGIEVISSGFKNGETGVGLDKFAYNLVEGSLTGPIIFKKDSTGKKTDPLVGFFLSGSYSSVLDPRPYHGGQWRLNDEARAELLENPLRINDRGATEFNAFYLTDNDFEKVPTRLNTGSKSVNLVGKFDINTSETTSLTFGATGAYGNRHQNTYRNQLMNWDNNQQAIDYDWRVYGKFSQRFVDAEEEEGSKASTLKNVYYSVMVDYSKVSRIRQDDTHKDDFFKYGHLGKFEIYDMNSYDNFNVQTGWQDTLVEYTASDYNPELAAINSQYFSLYPNHLTLSGENPYESLESVTNGSALRNGDVPDRVYNLWNYYGVQNDNYQTFDNRQFRVSANGSADIGDHAIQAGFEYEQRKDAAFSLSPTGLWTIGRQLVNSHINNLDTTDISIDQFQGATFVNFGRLIGDNQFQFDYKLRESLGLDPNGNDYINIDALDPEQFNLDMFSADELINNGGTGQLVSYFGYDPYGNKVKERSSLADFLNETNELGYSTRPISAFEPIYTSGYLMDKFSFDDIIFNVGVRVDRYDANQKVLKDPYVVGDAFTVGEVTSLGGNDVIHPTNIGDSYVVYVNNIDSPTAIAGYRDGETWYDATGAQVSDPRLIAPDVDPLPYLIGGKDAKLEASSFEDYNPAINIMPRIAFSFPISDEALFFAHYDILTQRPTSNNRFNPINYLFIENSNNFINNPNLRPEKTIDYELGFQQVLSKTSSLKISAFYREIRDQIQARSFSGAYPVTYTSYGNLDFGTVKGLTTTFDLRRTGNIRMVVSYTLQFADGTGSDADFARSLISAGLPNLRSIFPLNYDQRHRVNVTMDYRYGEGKAYNGPVWFDKPVFENTGVNLIANIGSGTPYTASRVAYSADGTGTPSTEGSVNGSRLPWSFTLDMNIDKNFALKFGKADAEAGEKQKTVNMNVYLWISNVLNSRNIRSVYRYTGVSDDDGYLSAAQFQDDINNQPSPDSYRKYYSTYVDNAGRIGTPRTIRLGLRLDF